MDMGNYISLAIVALGALIAMWWGGHVAEQGRPKDNKDDKAGPPAE
ncbi:MAG: hypothetical protein AAFY10_09995 [Pseudomonadota bacterium]